MGWMIQMLNSSLGRKYVMALTGLFLCSFLVIHWFGNMLLYVPDNGKTFNTFTFSMEHNILIRAMEYILFAGFIIHIIQSYTLTRQNQKARPIPYIVVRNTNATPWYSRYMGILGALIFFFLVVHLRNFFWDLRFTDKITDDAQSEIINLYPEVISVFSIWYYDVIYAVGVIALGYHLWHGFQSAFRSLGIMHKKYTPAIVWIGKIYTVIITGGFLSMPVYFYLSQYLNK
ncbi:MAG: succinate dehydrogenase cytochrome b subunit [Chitinophagales bacterium]|nr:succinate dehydrogenase cytochrome b subunit [Chitinophagales bacterium]